MSGFCWSRNALRGPGSVPPAPGRLGIGMVCPVCAWAAVAAIARPPAAVAANTLRREMFVMSSLASDSSGLRACRRMKRRSRYGAIKPSRRGARLSRVRTPRHRAGEVAARDFRHVYYCIDPGADPEGRVLRHEELNPHDIALRHGEHRGAARRVGRHQAADINVPLGDDAVEPTTF